MTRWEPDARGRLQRAALELYTERGFEETTVQDIASRAGVTERTYFRHFADKREVLFDGSHELEHRVVDGVAASEASIPLDMVADGFAAAAGIFDERRDWAKKRSAVVATDGSLQERELLKLWTMGTAIADALRERGVADRDAELAADLGVSAFHRSFQRWIGADDASPDASLGDCLRSTFAHMRSVLRECGELPVLGDDVPAR